MQGYTFSVVRGVQAGREYYTAMCPLRMIPKLFLFDEEELDASIRAQRVLNKSRVPKLVEYMLSNPEDYVFSAITASIDAQVEFIPVSDDRHHYNVGTIHIPMSAKLIVNDGQHRRAAIEQALKENPKLGSETIAIVFFIDQGLERSQQMFADLNRYAVRPTQSLNILYDHRDHCAELARRLAHKVPTFEGFTEIEKSSISNRSPKIFTLSAIHKATKELLEGLQELSPEEQEQTVIDFWTVVGSVIQEWNLVRKGEMSAYDLRRNYIHAHAIGLVALGRAGAGLLQSFPREWKERLIALHKVHWSRHYRHGWEGRVTIGGKISFSRNNLTLVTNVIKQALSVPLTPEEQKAENEYMSVKNGVKVE